MIKLRSFFFLQYFQMYNTKQQYFINGVLTDTKLKS